MSLLKLTTKSMSSIDQQIGDEGKRTLGDIIPDNQSTSIEQILDNQLIRARIVKALSSLTKREELVLRMRFGISEVSEDDDNVYEV